MECNPNPISMHCSPNSIYIYNVIGIISSYLSFPLISSIRIFKYRFWYNGCQYVEIINVYHQPINCETIFHLFIDFVNCIGSIQ